MNRAARTSHYTNSKLGTRRRSRTGKVLSWLRFDRNAFFVAPARALNFTLAVTKNFKSGNEYFFLSGVSYFVSIAAPLKCD